MALRDVTKASVHDAITEYDRLGQVAFLEQYHFAPARAYRLVHGGRFYDSKAIVGVAHGYATGTFWTAPDFSGGHATVGTTLTNLGFVVDVDMERTNGGLLANLEGLPVATYNGDKAPYQYLLLLWAIARAYTEAPRLARFSEVAQQLRELLAPFALSSSTPNPANPWAALKDSPWWQIDLPPNLLEGPLPWKEVTNLNPPAGLSEAAYNKIRTEPAWTQQVLEVITRIIGDHPAYDDIVALLGLSRLRIQTPSGAVVTAVPLSKNTTERFTIITAGPSPQDRARREANLQNSYAEYLRSHGHTVHSRRIELEHTSLYLDMYDESTGELIEVKSTTDRMTIRLALGQILDYARFVDHQYKSILFPERPTEELIALLHSHGVSVAWAVSSGQFTMNRPASD